MSERRVFAAGFALGAAVALLACAIVYGGVVPLLAAGGISALVAVAIIGEHGVQS